LEETRDKKGKAYLDDFLKIMVNLISRMEKDKKNIEEQYKELCNQTVRDFMSKNSPEEVYKSYEKVCENYKGSIDKKEIVDEYLDALLDLVQSIVELENAIIREAIKNYSG